MENIISIIINIVGIYLVLGVLFSIVFMWNSLEKVDKSVKGSSRFFKVLIFPGMIIFWILFLKKWLNRNDEL
jgi:4-hydroxybenzoate polyprenyltransferase